MNTTTKGSVDSSVSTDRFTSDTERKSFNKKASKEFEKQLSSQNTINPLFSRIAGKDQVIKHHEAIGLYQKYFHQMAGKDKKIRPHEAKAFFKKNFNKLAGRDGKIDSNEAKQNKVLNKYFDRIAGKDGKIDFGEFHRFIHSKKMSVKFHGESNQIEEMSSLSATGVDPALGAGLTILKSYETQVDRAEAAGVEIRYVLIEDDEGNKKIIKVPVEAEYTDPNLINEYRKMKRLVIKLFGNTFAARYMQKNNNKDDVKPAEAESAGAGDGDVSGASEDIGISFFK